MIHVDDLIEPGAKQILLARLPPFPWPHLVLPLEPRYDSESRIRFARKPHSNAKFPANAICKAGRFAIPNQPLGGSSRTTIYTYSHMFGRPPAETEMQRHFAVSPLSVLQMIVTLERNGFIRRQAGAPRSIEILVPPENLPILSWLGIKPSKSL
jgi:hypothetical protein